MKKIFTLVKVDECCKDLIEEFGGKIIRSFDGHYDVQFDEHYTITICPDSLRIIDNDTCYYITLQDSDYTGFHMWKEKNE